MTTSTIAALTTHDTTRIDDVRIGAVRPLITPALLEEKLPVPAAAEALVESSRAAISRSLTISGGWNTWPAGSRITPWGDTFEGFAPSGRQVEIERRYLWAHEPAGAVAVEIEVRDLGARTGAEARALITPPR